MEPPPPPTSQLGPFACRADGSSGDKRSKRKGKAAPVKGLFSKTHGGAYALDDSMGSSVETMAIYLSFVRSFNSFGPFSAR